MAAVGPFADDDVAEFLEFDLAGRRIVIPVGGSSKLRHFINATIGFEPLAVDLQKPSRRRHRMVGPKGNPNTASLFAILLVLQKRAGRRTGGPIRRGRR
jgi:hypothetical protein